MPRFVALAAMIVAGGVILPQTGEAIADGTGLGAGLVGLVLLAVATSLPELTMITTAMRGGHYELAVGDVFGANLFNVAMIFVIDLVHKGQPIPETAGAFEAVAALTTAAMIPGLFGSLAWIGRKDQ